MKRYLIPTLVVLTVLTVTWVVFGQEQERERARAGRGGFVPREMQQKAIEAIEQQAAKLKAGMEAATMPAGQTFQDLSDEERAKLKEKFAKMREERQQAIAAIEEQIAILKGRRQLQQEHDEAINELQEIHSLATKEKAAETAKRLEELIAKRNKAFEEKVQKLGFPEGRFGTGPGPGGAGPGPGPQPGQGQKQGQ